MISWSSANARGLSYTASARSTTSVLTPACPSRLAHTAPTGPNPAITTSKLFRDDADILGQFRPAPMLRAQELAQLRGRSGAFGDDAEFHQALRRIRFLHGCVQVAVEAADRLLRRPGRRYDRVPADVLEAFPGLAQRRHLLEAAHPLGRAHRDRPQRAALEM